jgi:hypothetical protein
MRLLTKVRLWWRVFRALTRARKELNMDKPMVASVTNWGAVIAGAGEIVYLVTQAVGTGQPIQWGELLPKVITVVGLVVAAIGARRMAGKMLAKP